MVLTLVRVEGDDGLRSQAVQAEGGSIGHQKLYVLVSAYFNPLHYGEGLKFLEQSILFFEQNPVFTPANAPDLDPGILQIRVSRYSLSLGDTSALWAGLGAKYMPSVLYEVQVEYVKNL